jgi:hypothetical protein
MYTLKQLAEDAAKLLQELPPDTPVETEGCDCIGPAASVRVEKRDATVVVIVARQDGA